MNLLSKNKTTPAAPVPTINVDSARHEITQIHHTVGVWQREHAGLEAAASKDWATDTLNRVRRRELQEFIAEAETRIAELSAQVTSADDGQAAERLQLENRIVPAFEAIASQLLQVQKSLDELRPLLDAHTSVGGYGIYHGQLNLITNGVVAAGNGVGLMETFSYEKGKRLVKMPRQ